MPIRINLLAEQQLAEEERRRDPVKRAWWIAAGLVTLVLVWVASNQLRIVSASNALAAMESEWRRIATDYSETEKILRATVELEQRLLVLDRLSADRFTLGSLLDALQRVMVDDIQLTRIRTVQSFLTTEVESSQPGGRRQTPSQAATTICTSKLVIEGRDFSEDAGGMIGRFKDKILGSPFFQEYRVAEGHLSQTGGITLRTIPQTEVSYVNFKLECRFPDTVPSR